MGGEVFDYSLGNETNIYIQVFQVGFCAHLLVREFSNYFLTLNIEGENK